MLSNEHVVIKDGPIEEQPAFTTPKKTRLGPRASQRHSQLDEPSPAGDENMAEAPRSMSARKVRVEMVETESPVSRNVFSRLGPRAASRHASATPEQNGSNKRHLVRDSPRRNTDHKDKRYRVGTPTRDKNTPTRDDHVFSTPESIRNARNNQRGKFKTPNSDSRLYTKNSGNKTRLAGSGKDLFGNSRKRGTSESNKETEPLKPLSEEQIAKREKQVRYGKVTDGYQNYKSIVPKNLRNIRDPATPKKDYPYSKRCWDGLVRSWRRKLHEWDSPKVGLELRAAYTNNNKDLKDGNLVNEAGEIEMFTTSQEDQTTITELQEPIPTEPEPTEPEPIEPDAQQTPFNWNIPKYHDTIDDDMKSQDSDYTQLLGNEDDFPESDESDTSYHLSQDSNLGRNLSIEEDEELMECNDESITGKVEHNFSLSVFN